MVSTTRINIKITNDIGELSEKEHKLSFDEMMAQFPCLAAQIEEARDYAKDNNILEEELYSSVEEMEMDKEDKYS